MRGDISRLAPHEHTASYDTETMSAMSSLPLPAVIIRFVPHAISQQSVGVVMLLPHRVGAPMPEDRVRERERASACAFLLNQSE